MKDWKAEKATKKTYGLLFTFTALAISGILISRPLMEKSAPVVTLYTVEARSATDTVTCTGRIEAADSEDVYVEMPCIADTVSVQAGDAVQKGDILFTVDVAATKQVLASAGGISPALIPEQQIVKSVSAPVDGVIRTLNVAAGETVDADTPCVVISSSDALQVKVTIHENNLRDIVLGQRATVSGTAFREEGYAGTVTYISPSARQQYSGTTSETVVDAIISLLERDDSLKPGLSAKSRIEIGSVEECIIIPYEYVLQDEKNQEYVYLWQDGKAVKRVIQTAKEWNDGFEVTDGLYAGDCVIQNPGDIDRDGQTVVVSGEGETTNA